MQARARCWRVRGAWWCGDGMGVRTDSAELVGHGGITATAVTSTGGAAGSRAAGVQPLSGRKASMFPCSFLAGSETRTQNELRFHKTNHGRIAPSATALLTQQIVPFQNKSRTERCTQSQTREFSRWSLGSIPGKARTPPLCPRACTTRQSPCTTRSGWSGAHQW